MALVTPTKAIQLSGRSKAAFYKDVAAGKVSKTMQGSKSFFDTSELVRAYGALRIDETAVDVSYEQSQTVRDAAILEERIRSLETSLRQREEIEQHLQERIKDKEAIIEELKTKVLMIEYVSHSSTFVRGHKEEKPGVLAWLFGRNK